jgi:hypothetical protein
VAGEPLCETKKDRVIDGGACFVIGRPGPAGSVSLHIPYRPAEARQEGGEAESGRPLLSEFVFDRPGGDLLEPGPGTQALERSSGRRMKPAGPAAGPGEMGRDEPTRKFGRWRVPCRVWNRIVGAWTHRHAPHVAEPAGPARPPRSLIRPGRGPGPRPTDRRRRGAGRVAARPSRSQDRHNPRTGMCRMIRRISGKKLRIDLRSSNSASEYTLGDCCSDDL